jgi:hypothetical protein
MHFLTWSRESGWAVAVQCSLGWLLLGVSRRSSRGASSRANWAAGAGHSLNTEEMMQMLAKFGGHFWPKSTCFWHFHFTITCLMVVMTPFFPLTGWQMFRMSCELSLYLARSGSGPQERVQCMYQEVGVTRELVRVGLVYLQLSMSYVMNTDQGYVTIPISAYTQKRLYRKAPLPKSAYTDKRVYPKALHKTSFWVIWPRFRADNPYLTLVLGLGYYNPIMTQFWTRQPQFGPCFRVIQPNYDHWKHTILMNLTTLTAFWAQ